MKFHKGLKTILILFVMLFGTAAFSQEEVNPETWKDFIDSLKNGDSELLKNADFKLIIDGKEIKDTDKIPFSPLLTKEMSIIRSESPKDNPEKAVFTISVTTSDDQIIKESFSPDGNG